MQRIVRYQSFADGYTMKKDNILRVYSKKKRYFLAGLGFRYIETCIDESDGSRYWTFEKSDKLFEAVKLYNSVKYDYIQ